VSLWADFLAHNQREMYKCTHYFPAYEAHFSRYRDQPITMFEIGCGEGGSLQLWKGFFGPHAQIVGIDIAERCKGYEEDQIAVRIGSQSDTDFLDTVLQEFGAPDIVLDDGSHQMDDIHASFRHLYPLMAARGVYAVEDLHTAYWPHYGGGLREPGSFMETCKVLVDELHADWTVSHSPPTAFTRSTTSIHFYNSLVVFERGRHREAVLVKVGGATT
jgi:cephalosporin hydroxylase